MFAITIVKFSLNICLIFKIVSIFFLHINNYNYIELKIIVADFEWNAQFTRTNEYFYVQRE